MFNIIFLITQGSPQSVLDGLLVRTLAKTVLRAMQHIILLRHSCLLSKYAVPLDSMMLAISTLLFAVRNGTSPYPLLTRYPKGFISVRMGCHCKVCKPIDLGRFPFSINFNLDGGQEVTPIFMIQGLIVLLIFLQLIMHGWEDYVFNSSLNLIIREVLVTDVPTSCLITLAVHRRWR